MSTPSNPTNTPNAPQAAIDTQTPQHPGDASNAAKLPHERDQSVNMTDATPSPEMQQAHRDVQKGLVDTDARGADGKPLGDDVPTG
jgi:hypothetical protein